MAKIIHVKTQIQTTLARLDEDGTAVAQELPLNAHQFNSLSETELTQYVKAVKEEMKRQEGAAPVTEQTVRDVLAKVTALESSVSGQQDGINRLEATLAESKNTLTELKGINLTDQTRETLETCKRTEELFKELRTQITPKQ